MSQSFPEHFQYDEKTRELEVEFRDGSINRYFDIDPKSAFLYPGSPPVDFLNYINQRHHHPTCPDRKNGAPCCSCPILFQVANGPGGWVIKNWEVVKEARR